MDAPARSRARSTETKRLHATHEDAGRRLDLFLADRLRVGRRLAARLAEHARVNGRRASKGLRLSPGDHVDVVRSEDAELAAPLAEVQLVLADDLVLVVDKPAGLPSVAIAGRHGPSLAGWIARHHPECAGVGGPLEGGLVHRLDTWTSGLVLVARTPAAHVDLREQFRRHEIAKGYIALVWGRLAAPLTIDAEIGQHRKSRRRVRALPPGKHPRYASSPALTTVVPLRRAGPLTLVEARTRTGARHQIRAHLAFAGHPLAGDRHYGGAPSGGLTHYLLHASEIAWRDPQSGRPRKVRREPPPSWRDLCSGHEGENARDRAS